MLKTEFFNAIRTESGKWLKWDGDISEWYLHSSNSDGPSLHKRLFDCDKERAERETGEPCHLVPVALVDVEYLRELEALAKLISTDICAPAEECDQCQQNGECVYQKHILNIAACEATTNSVNKKGN